MSPLPVMMAPMGISQRGPYRSISTPVKGPSSIDAAKPAEKMPATMARVSLNSSRIAGNSKENAVRELTPTANVIKATLMTTQP